MMGGMDHGTRAGQPDEETFGRVYDHKIFVRLFPYILPHVGMTTLATLTMLLYTATLVAIPWIIKIGIDDFIEGKDFMGLTWVLAFFLFVTGLNGVSNYLQQSSIAKVGQNILHELRRQMFAHLQRLSLSYYDKTHVGSIMSRVQGDVWQLQELTSVVIMTLADLLSLIGIIIALLIMDLKLGLISMSVLPLLALIMILWQPYALKSFLRVRRAIAIVNSSLNENITGVRVVQSMNRQDRNQQVFDGYNSEHLKANLIASKLAAGLLPPVDILTAVAIGLALFFGGRMVMNDALEVGVLIAFIMYIQRFFDPIRNLTMQYTQLQRSMASGARIFELLDIKADLVDSPKAKTLPKLRGEVEFQHVTFRYDENQKGTGSTNEISLCGTDSEHTESHDVLKDINLHINPGETVAIVGPTGAGKTTLVSLISRFYDIPHKGSGRILVDGYDIRDVTRKSLVGQTSMVLQEPYLFSGTVMENIKYNHTEASEGQVVEAAKASGAHGFILQLEEGYNTYLQERGGNLSLGERQLISFARAIVADPHILILDEATANIDSYTELLIQRALEKLLKGRTAIVIAHRLSTIRGADKIVVLNLGEIEEMGTHDELMERNGLYAHLYLMNYTAIENPDILYEDGRSS